MAEYDERSTRRDRQRRDSGQIASGNQMYGHQGEAVYTGFSGLPLDVQSREDDEFLARILDDEFDEDEAEQIPEALTLADSSGDRQLVFIDSSVEDQEIIIDNVLRSAEVIVLEPDEDEVLQIGDYLSQYEQIDAVHIISHGGQGNLSFANTSLNQETLPQYSESLKGWRNSLTESADVIFYGCDIASGEDGQALIQEVSTITAADVLASVDVTGQDGDWDLEASVGEIETTSEIVNPQIEGKYQSSLANGNSDAGLEELGEADNRIAQMDPGWGAGMPGYEESQEAYMQGLQQIAPGFFNLALDFVPFVGDVKGIAEAIVGRDITGEELAAWERVLGAIPLFGGVLKRAGTGIEVLIKLPDGNWVKTLNIGGRLDELTDFLASKLPGWAQRQRFVTPDGISIEVPSGTTANIIEENADSINLNRIDTNQPMQTTGAGSQLRPANPSRVVNDLRSFSTRTFRFGNETFQLDKSGMKHILERHHPRYWNGTTRSRQTFLDRSMSIDGVADAVLEVMKQNRDKIIEEGTNSTYQIEGVFQGITYVLGFRNGRVGQFYPK